MISICKWEQLRVTDTCHHPLVSDKCPGWLWGSGGELVRELLWWSLSCGVEQQRGDLEEIPLLQWDACVIWTVLGLLRGHHNGWVREKNKTEGACDGVRGRKMRVYGDRLELSVGSCTVGQRHVERPHCMCVFRVCTCKLVNSLQMAFIAASRLSGPFH